MNEETAYFRYFDSYRKYVNRKGPYSLHHQEQIGSHKFFHTKEELLQCDFSDTIKKRINSAKIGTKIKLHYLHNAGDLCIERVPLELIEKYQKLDELNLEMQKINEEIREATETLQNKKKIITKQIREQKKILGI